MPWTAPSVKKIELAPNEDAYFVGGHFAGTRDFDPDPAQEFNLTSAADGSLSSGFVAKYSGDGGFLDAWRLTNSERTWITEYVVDTSGEHVYLTGANDTTGRNILVAKYSVQGQRIWETEIGGADVDIGRAIDIDAEGNAYITGSFKSATIDFDPGAESFVLNNPDSNGAQTDFTLKLDVNGDFQWVQSFGLYNAWPFEIEYRDASVQVTGPFKAGDSSDPWSLYVAQLNALDGSEIWSHQVTEVGGEIQTTALTVDHLGNVWLTGAFLGSVDFDPDPNDSHILSTEETVRNSDGWQVFIWKLDSTGDFLWAENLPGGGDHDVFEVRNNTLNVPRDIQSDATGNIYVGGDFGVATDFDPGPGEFLLDPKNGLRDGFVLSLDNDGTFRWVTDFKTADEVIVRSLAVDTLGNVHATGRFAGTADFDPTDETFELTAASDSDMFVVKLTQPDLAPATPGITVTPTSELETSENGGTASFTVVLDTQPTADVIIYVTTLDETEGTVSVTQLIFTPDNWETPQEVIITGVDDSEKDGDQDYTIQLTAESTDSDYDVLDPDDVFVTNKDDEKKGGRKK